MSLSLSPGMTGAMPMPVAMPAEDRILRVSKRCEGRLALGSIARPVRSSEKGMDRETQTRVSRAIFASRSTSRRTSAPLVMIPTGLRNSAQISRQRRVSSYTASSGW